MAFGFEPRNEHRACYASAEPIIPGRELEALSCSGALISSDEFGEGNARGVSAPQMEDTILTFPPFGPSIDHTAGTA
ncbi:hypothetical protein FGU65_05605 [Methanoculleus sp. FWC-SCC1]|uniref:Uncharacterized protein n=1 Tax=Methanoculleus frigidifontis TaxID=2584085 RepID=A0ABT8M8V6_9EURY|nr:hypothetical protein [Methanoculleus sp. FWC-SCC1]MDN7024371.1 hypothetical protein [Methanoculleus sp. FWC-SCC1]